MEEKNSELTKHVDEIIDETEVTEVLNATEMVTHDENHDDVLTVKTEDEIKEPTEEEIRDQKIEFIKQQHYGNSKPKKVYDTAFKTKRKKKNKQAKKSRKQNCK